MVILTAGYILWAIQRVYLGPEYKGPHPEAITPINQREAAIGFILLFFAILLGVYPRTGVQSDAGLNDPDSSTILMQMFTTALKC